MNKIFKFLIKWFIYLSIAGVITICFNLPLTSWKSIALTIIATLLALGDAFQIKTKEEASWSAVIWPGISLVIWGFIAVVLIFFLLKMIWNFIF